MPKPNNAPQVNIQRPCYAMASTDGQSADITMYGKIVDTQPTDWWTGEPIPGQYIIESEFLSDLQQVEHCSEITIRMDSVGGDAGVSILIHNRLRELAAKGTKLTCIVDGVAMSGGSLIMCACDTVKANPSSLVMIHKCWSLIWGNYNADELRKAADANDAWDKSQVSIYKRKTGLSNQLKAALGEHEEGKFDNGQIVRWKRIEKNLLDSKRLKAEKPEIYNQYTSVNAYRTLSIAS
mgnify:CR=1 FL=1